MEEDTGNRLRHCLQWL